MEDAASSLTIDNRTNGGRSLYETFRRGVRRLRMNNAVCMCLCQIESDARSQGSAQSISRVKQWHCEIGRA